MGRPVADGSRKSSVGAILGTASWVAEGGAYLPGMPVRVRGVLRRALWWTWFVVLWGVGGGVGGKGEKRQPAGSG